MSVEHLSINVEKHMGEFFLAVKADLPVNGVTAIFGPSGSGKSSLLRLLLGLEKPDKGQISLGQHTLFDSAKRINLAPHKRKLSAVFQDARLIPHLTVEENLLFAKKRARENSRDDLNFTSIVDAFDLAALLPRKPATLSGGERQRVALGQAILSAPRMLLLDEPLTGLDLARKQEILPYLIKLKTELSIPILYVSHNVHDIVQLADHVLALENGRVKGLGFAVSTLNNFAFGAHAPARPGVILEGAIKNVDDTFKLVDVSVSTNTVRLPLTSAAAIGQNVRLVINASDVVLSLKKPSGLSIQNVLQGTITKISPETAGPMATVSVQLEDTQVLIARVTRAALEDMQLTSGQPIFALVKTATFK